MANQKKSIDSKVIARELGDKIKKHMKDGNNVQEIPNIILDALKSHGIELPEKVTQAIQEYQTKL